MVNETPGSTVPLADTVATLQTHRGADSGRGAAAPAGRTLPHPAFAEIAELLEL